MTTPSKALVPDLTEIPAFISGDDLDDDLDGYLAKFVLYSNLRPAQRMLIKAYAEDLVTGKRRTDKKISKDTGIPGRTMLRFKSDPDFALANGFIMAHLTASDAGQIIADIRKCLANGSWNAGKFLLEMSGVYVQKLQVQSQNVNYNQTIQAPVQSFDEAVDELLISLGNQGWSANQIVERYEALRAAGAF